ncbi:hypothetical protein CRUP_010522 [Coryphaenoides rupestris]|nr:hypothetical protein CRUP_010522 [Coryphaenoides rupestris]
MASPESSSEECTVLEAPPLDPHCCLLHTGKLVELFCTVCACAACEDCISGDHEGHSTAPIKQALELQRTTLQDRLESAKARLAERLEELTNQGLPCHPEENDQLDLILETDGLRKSSITWEPSLAPDGSMVDGDIVDHKNGTYEFVYTLPKEGHFSLALRLYDQHIKGSPFKLAVSRTSDTEVSSPPTTTATSSAANATPSTGSSEGAKRRGKSPAQKKKASKRASSALGTPRRKTHNPIEDDLIYKIGSKGRNRGEFTNLQGVAASSTGKILIADSNNQCVQRPTGVAVHPCGDIIIADYDNKWVSIFTSDGKFKAKLGSSRLMGPKGVTVDHNGHVIVVDNKSCTVFIFQPTGKLISKFGSRGNGDKQFAGPHFAAVNNNNEIIVTDFHNHSVKVFTPDGDLVLKFGSNGEGNGQFNAPTGVAVDTNGNIIVADWGNSRIQVFDGSGSFLSYINTSADPLYGPQGLALTSAGHVVVADSGNHCFKVYRYLQ